MYCKDVVFTDAMEFSGAQAGWHMIAEPITGSSNEDFQRLLNFVRCRAVLAEDRQVDNILHQHELRNETRSRQRNRKEMQRMLGINHGRRMQFPFYYVKLKHDQLDKLFKNNPTYSSSRSIFGCKKSYGNVMKSLKCSGRISQNWRFYMKKFSFFLLERHYCTLTMFSKKSLKNNDVPKKFYCTY